MSDLVAPETHGLGAKLLWADHGLSPYWGVVSVHEPDHDADLDPFEAIGETWDVVASNHWEGQIAPPEDAEGIDGGLYEYSYTVEAEDAVGDKDVVLQFRPAFPNAENVHSGEPMQGIPDDLPRGIRVQIMSTNVTATEALRVLLAFAEHVGLNPDYFADDPHEWSQVYQYERYVRLARPVSEDHIVGSGGIIDRLADFASDQSGRGEYKWDNEEIVGHYLSVASDADTWGMLLPDEDQHGKALKNYHPANPRGDTSGSDPLAHPKVEISLSNEYDPDGSVSWSDLGDLQAELDESMLNVLSWAGVPLGPDAGVWVAEDPYFDVDALDRNIEIASNPLPDLREQTEKHVESELIRTEMSDAQEEVFTVLADGGQQHYETVAEEAGVGTSTVYRLVDKLPSLIESDGGLLDFADDVTRRHVQGIVDQVRETADWARESIRQVAQEHDILSADDGPLQEWMDRHGIRLVSEHPELEFELDRSVSDVKIRQILRAGLDAAEASGLLTERFESALISWTDLDGESHPGRRIVVGGDVLGRGAFRTLG
ncbi:hypothetical protein Hrd1104_00045 [Halorhabdus sp. CBA1104]|uniref:DUF7845 domain-containing protein n=1 Tax=Halorhabdus sp. CBA1104 TaxID=1380432 RepID=UPI0012B31AC1|nr:hypothetical protein [Halorhabdus sp. CBA1104]QGN05836.1 hypothetical protein Hrd1104_00045 [Halorhabdus sp. CBA1104]